MLKLLCGAEPADSHHLRHLELLTKAGVEIHLLDHSVNFEAGNAPVATHMRWPRSGLRTLGKVFGPAIGNRLADWAVSRQLKSVWRRSRADVCHIHWIDERPLRCATAGLRPLVATAYGSDLNQTGLPDYDPQLLKQVKKGLAQVDLFIADSEDMIGLAQELAGRELNSLLLPIGIDTNLFRPGYTAEATAWRAELEIPEDAHVILSPRVIVRNYRQAEIMRAFAKAVGDGALDAYMVFKAYVSDPTYVEEIRAIAALQGVPERIRIIEEVPYQRLPVLYAMADFAINFPAMDAFPVTFLECSACELPILSNRRPAYSSNGMAEHLIFLEGEDEQAISRHLVSMCVAEGGVPRAREARAHVVRNFNESAFVGTLLSAYDGLISARRAA
jgi:hypothetical protein